jgi:hypothetical protein
MNIKKAILLSLALLLPVAVFVFLKFFGKNEFDVPAFYQDGKPPVTSDCSYSYAMPYVIPDSVMVLVRKDENKSLYVVHFSSPENLSRVVENYGSDIDVITDPKLGDPHVRKCVLLMKESQDIILIDDQKRIRGYYTSKDREEIDRLLLELDILLKKY